jgi:polar amino acid transport system permease protein
MSYRTMMRYVIVPQAARVVLPPLTNEAITLLKATSLVVTIGVPDVTFRAYDVASKTFNSLPILFFAGVIYFGIAYPLSLVVRRMERRLSVDRMVAA